MDHSPLFSKSDIVEIPYHYADNVTEMRIGLSRKLSSVSKRLDLMGYSSAMLPGKYQQYLEMHSEHCTQKPISFEQFVAILDSIDIDKISLNTEYPDYDLGEFVSRNIFRDPEIRKRIPADVSVDTDLGVFFENLDPYIILKILSDNKKKCRV